MGPAWVTAQAENKGSSQGPVAVSGLSSVSSRSGDLVMAMSITTKDVGGMVSYMQTFGFLLYREQGRGETPGSLLINL